MRLAKLSVMLPATDLSVEHNIENGRPDMGSNIATAALVIVGVLMVILGLFGGPEYVVMGMGVVALVAAGILGVLQTRALSR